MGREGVKAWVRRFHAFFTFCFEMSGKLFKNGYLFGCIPTTFLLASLGTVAGAMICITGGSVTSLVHQGGEELSNTFKLCPTHFSGRRKIF